MATEKASTAPMHKNRTTTLGRISGMIGTGIFRNINLTSKIYKASIPVTDLKYWSLPEGSSGEWEKYNYMDIIGGINPEVQWKPVQAGQRFGPTWSTHWFRLEFTAPAAWAGEEVHLRWATGCEGLIYDEYGGQAQGLSAGFREEYRISAALPVGGSKYVYYIEMACNDMFGAGNGDMIAPTDNNRTYAVDRCEIAILNKQIYAIDKHLDVLNQIANQLPNDHRGYQAMFCANEMINLIEVDGNWDKAEKIAEAFFAEGGGTKNHTLYSMGHCHIDTAWLWPYEETKRKVARSWSAQLRLLRDYPETTFTASSAQQFEWLEETWPDIFASVKAQIATGRFIPVGGSWIEMDGNIPNGESFIRQFLYGQKYFQEKFNFSCKEFWLPDTFGYAAQIPQMLAHVGIHRFLTQKMSWNLVNKFPHHNFLWEGIDGTQVLTHFPPGDSYNMNGNVSEFLFSVNNSQDKGRANSSIYLYGYGDGGGGPVKAHIEKQMRCVDVDGLPKIKFAGPDEFFEELEKEKGKLCKWVGELYLELHNGTYTSQAKIKWYNRKGEFFLREIEQLIAMAVIQKKLTAAEYNRDRNIVDRCWKDLLLNQFHDILPGSCVEIAAQRAWERYVALFENLTKLRGEYNARILGTGTNKAVFNYLPWKVRTVLFSLPSNNVVPTGNYIESFTLNTTPFENQGEGQFRVPNKFGAALVELEPSGFTNYVPLEPVNRVTIIDTNDSISFDNGIIAFQVSKSSTAAPTENNLTYNQQRVFNDRLATGTNAGQLYFYTDIPLYWDAWDVMDYHLETRKELPVTASHSVQLVTGTSTPANAGIAGIYKYNTTFGNGSTIERYTIVRADSAMLEYFLIVNWKEGNKMLKVEFPVDVLSREATYEIQYGHAKRPTHMNTSWDSAKFEVCGHKWVDISQSGKGVTFITDSKYGWHIRDNIVKMSLLKSPKNPDANCDMHTHYIHYAVLPHDGNFQEANVIKAAYELNVFGANNIPLVLNNTADANLPNNWVSTGHDGVIVEAFKTGYASPTSTAAATTAILRLYESFGGAVTTTININFPYTEIRESDGMETDGGAVVATGSETSFEATFTPFQIRTYLIKLAP